MNPVANADKARGRLRPPRIGIVIIAMALAASMMVRASEHQTGWFLGSGQSLAQSPGFGASFGQDECVPLMRRCGGSIDGWKLAAGYRFSPYFSAEFEYGDFAERPAPDPLGLDPSSGPLIRGLNLSATATWPVLKRLDLFGRVGTRRWEMAEGRALDIAPSLGEDRVTMQLGAGMNYDISDSVGFRAEWEHHRGILGGFGNETDEDVFSGYLRFRF